MIQKICESIKQLFVKEEIFPCLVWDGKIMNYLNLTQKEIIKMENESDNEELKIIKKEEL